MKSDTLSDTMRIKEELIAQITKKSKTEYLISFWYGNKRYRYSNGRAIGLDLSPNLFPVRERVRHAEVLCSAFTMAIREGWRPVEVEERMSIGSVADRSLKRKLKLDYSVSYNKDLAYVKRLWDEYLSKKRLENCHCLRAAQRTDPAMEPARQGQASPGYVLEVPLDIVPYAPVDCDQRTA